MSPCTMSHDTMPDNSRYWRHYVTKYDTLGISDTSQTDTTSGATPSSAQHNANLDSADESGASESGTAESNTAETLARYLRKKVSRTQSRRSVSDLGFSVILRQENAVPTPRTAALLSNNTLRKHLASVMGVNDQSLSLDDFKWDFTLRPDRPINAPFTRSKIRASVSERRLGQLDRSLSSSLSLDSNTHQVASRPPVPPGVKHRLSGTRSVPLSSMMASAHRTTIPTFEQFKNMRRTAATCQPISEEETRSDGRDVSLSLKHDPQEHDSQEHDSQEYDAEKDDSESERTRKQEVIDLTHSYDSTKLRHTDTHSTQRRRSENDTLQKSSLDSGYEVVDSKPPRPCRAGKVIDRSYDHKESHDLNRSHDLKRSLDLRKRPQSLDRKNSDPEISDSPLSSRLSRSVELLCQGQPVAPPRRKREKNYDDHIYEEIDFPGLASKDGDYEEVGDSCSRLEVGTFCTMWFSEN